MSRKLRQYCTLCHSPIRQGFSDGVNLFCSQGDEERRTCFERFEDGLKVASRPRRHRAEAR